MGARMTYLPQHGRRRLLGFLATLPVLVRAGEPLAAPPARVASAAPPVAIAPFPDGANLLVAGPNDGALSRWADAVLPALEQSLPPDTSIRRTVVGGADGVTGANQFEARGAPDGLTVLLVPGQAALAWMVGDPRAQFDVGRWVPVMAAVVPGLVVGRQAVLGQDGRVRIAAGGPAGLDLPALLGCELLGVRAEPVSGLTEPAMVRNAFAQGLIDAAFLNGHGMAGHYAALAAAGAQPLFTLGALDDVGQMGRDPAFPDVPHLAELYEMRSGRKLAGPLYDAWGAAAAAARLEFALVLPQLTPAAMVSLWRRAGTEATAAAAVRTVGTSLGVRPLGGPAATAGTAATAADSTSLLELRRWLASRFNWHPTQ